MQVHHSSSDSAALNKSMRFLEVMLNDGKVSSSIALVPSWSWVEKPNASLSLAGCLREWLLRERGVGLRKKTGLPSNPGLEFKLKQSKIKKIKNYSLFIL